MVEIQIIEGPLSPMEARNAAAPAAGAQVCFEGIVRPTEDGRPIVALEYEVYEPMATRELRRLATEITDEFGLLALVAVHSRGCVPVGACSFRLHIAAGHRGPALQAMAEFIDQLKHDVPIWKRPVFDADPVIAPAGGGETVAPAERRS